MGRVFGSAGWSCTFQSFPEPRKEGDASRVDRLGRTARQETLARGSAGLSSRFTFMRRERAAPTASGAMSDRGAALILLVCGSAPLFFRLASNGSAVWIFQLEPVR